ALSHSDVLICSGTVIAPHAILTAGHCLDSELLDVAVGDTLAAATRQRALAAFPHPDFDANTLDHDIAILIVDPPLAVAPISISPTLDATVGSTIRAVGYGWTVVNDTTPAVRRTGTSQIDTIDELRISVHAAPAQACEGDSGGPALFDAGSGERVIGVTSSGDPTCTQFARYTRVDVHSDFVLDTVARTSAGGAGAGDRCWYDANCSVGTCLPATDDDRLSFCAPSCVGGCPGDLECITVAGDARCRHPAPSPGAEGSACKSDGDCAGGLCLAPKDSSSRVCTTRCFSDLPGFDCPGDETCQRASDAGEACFVKADEGWCNATRGDASPVLLLLALVQVLRGRGRP
ncbi:MAG TPA: trypsin-like serine protease, partial [Kofleriaceae bacterium]|nr:trypsin-like serine protease [Kofleriaceae bacterium]